MNLYIPGAVSLPKGSKSCQQRLAVWSRKGLRQLPRGNTVRLARKRGRQPGPNKQNPGPQTHVIERHLQDLYDLQHDEDVKETVDLWFKKPPVRARNNLSADSERQVVIYNRLARRQSSEPTPESESAKVRMYEGISLTSKELLALSQPRMDNPRKWFQPQDLALLGDAVWDVYVQRVLILGFHKQQQFKLNAGVARSGQFQAYALRVLLDGFDLTNEEQSVIRWALKSQVTIGKLKSQRKVREVRQANALEAFVGYLYLTDPERLHDVLQALGLEDYDVMAQTTQQLDGPQIIDERIFQETIGTLPLGKYGEEDIEEEWQKQAQEVVGRRKHFDWLLQESTGGERCEITMQQLQR